MIVTRHEAFAIAAGHVTERRLPLSRRPPRPGRRITVRRENAWSPYCTIEVLSAERHPTHTGTLGAAGLRAVGWPSLEDYVRAWLLERDTAWLAKRVPEDYLGLTSDEEAEAAAYVLEWEVLERRWERHWADMPVWVLRWRVDADPPRLLAQSGGLRYRKLPSGRWVIDESDEHPDADHGYTTSIGKAMPDEPEAVDVATLRPRWADAARVNHLAAEDPRARARRISRGLR